MKKFFMCLLLALALSVNALALEVPTNTVVQNLNGSQQLIKTFVLSPDKDPQELIEEPFEQEGYLYTFADIVKEDNHVADAAYHRETVTVETGTNGEFTTDENGCVVIPGLTPGTTVTAKEIKVPEGVVLDSTPKSILIKEGEAQVLRFVNKTAGTLVIKKLDKLTNKPLAGVEFELTYAEGGYVDNANGHLSSNGRYTTNDAGEIRISGVTGTIVVKEVKCLSGYTIDPAMQTQTVKVNPADTQTLTFYNTPGTTLTIQKLITGTKDQPLAGVEFLITDSSGAYIGPNQGIYRTDEYGRITLTDLKPGTVITAKETKTVDGYVLDGTPKSIEIKEGEAQTLTFYNAPVGGLELIKVSASDETKRIPGVTFEIRGMDGALLETVTTGENGRVHVSLDAGDYYAVELKAAEGFKIDATPHYFTIKDNETTTLTVTNAPFGEYP